MTIHLTEVTFATLWRIGTIARDPDVAPWAADVERIILDGAGASHLGQPSSALLAADASGAVVGAALHYRHEHLHGAQYVAAILVDHRHRGTGLGRELTVATIADARSRSGREFVTWAVHPANEPMLHISDTVATRFGVDSHTDYIQFVDP